MDRRVIRELLGAVYGLLSGILLVSVGTWPPSFSWRSAVGHVGTRGGNIYMGPMILCAAVLTTLLMIGGVEQNPGL